MTPRRRLANRRASTTFSFEVGGLAYIATASWYPDGAVGEIFLSNHKSNSTADVNAHDAAIACSLALQFGADVETIRKALCRDSHGRARGPLGAALDIIARDNQYR
jgi:UDP-N-acetylmuramyl tripeptide synthase